MRYITRITLRLGIIILILWGILQSCMWMGEMSGEATYNNYGRSHYSNRYNRTSSSSYQDNSSNETENVSYDTYPY